MASPTVIANLSSQVAGLVPTTAQLPRGVIAINHTDGKLFFRYDASGGSKATAVWTQDTLTDLAQLANSAGYLTASTNASLVVSNVEAFAFKSIASQGAYLQWNRDSASGQTWLVNQKGLGGGGGFVFGESTTSNVVTKTFGVDASGNVSIIGNATVTGNLTVGGTVNGSSGSGSGSSGSGNFTTPITIGAAVTGDFTASNNTGQINIVSPTTSGGDALITFNTTNQTATKIGVSPSSGFVIGGWSFPANALVLNAAGSLAIVGHMSHTDLIHVSYFGVRADGVSDDTVAFQAAVSSGKNLRLMDGTMVISNQINFTTQGQVIVGSNPWLTTVLAKAPWPSGAGAVFNIAAVGVELREFCLDHVQPATGTSFNSFPPSLYINGQDRVRMHHVRVSRGSSGVYLVNECGGATLHDLELSCFGVNIHVDGSADSIRIYNPHIWPWNLPGNSDQFNYFLTSPNCVGISLGRADDIGVYGGLIITGGSQLSTFNGTGALPGPPFGKFVGVGFDTGPNINLASNGFLLFSACYFTCGGSFPGLAPNVVFLQSAGTVTLSSCHFLIAQTLTSGYAIDLNSTTGAQTNFVGCDFTTSVNQPLFAVGGSAHVVSIAGGTVVASTQVSSFLVNLASGRGTISGLTFVGSGSVGIAINTNLNYTLSAIDFGSQTLEIVSPNPGVTVVGCLGGINSILPYGLTTAKLVVNSTPPSSSTATGTAGTLTWDGTYFYVCVAANSWKRVALSSF